MCGRVNIFAEASVAVIKFVVAALGQCKFCKFELPNGNSSHAWESIREPIFGIAQMLGEYGSEASLQSCSNQSCLFPTYGQLCCKG